MNKMIKIAGSKYFEMVPNLGEVYETPISLLSLKVNTLRKNNFHLASLEEVAQIRMNGFSSDPAITSVLAVNFKNNPTILMKNSHIFDISPFLYASLYICGIINMWDNVFALELNEGGTFYKSIELNSAGQPPSEKKDIFSIPLNSKSSFDGNSKLGKFLFIYIL